MQLLIIHKNQHRQKPLITSIFTLFVMIHFIVFSTVFLHSHISETGQLLVHSHYNKNNNNSQNNRQHDHTKSEYLFFDLVLNSCFLLSILFFIIINCEFISLPLISNNDNISFLSINNIVPRAPPTV